MIKEQDTAIQKVDKVYTIEEIKDIVVPVLKGFGVKKIGIFGSYAKGKANSRSDIDLLVILPDKFDLLSYLNIESKLKETFKKEIDILDYRCIPTYMKDAILDGSITVYEEK
jgi:hypothetical protein